jgi:MFS family permease
MFGMLTFRPTGAARWLPAVTIAKCWYLVYGGLAGWQFLVNQLLIPDIFGRKVLGRLNGLQMAFGTMGSGLGPLFFAAVHRWWGSYDGPVLLCFLAVSAGAAVLGAVNIPTPPPK